MRTFLIIIFLTALATACTRPEQEKGGTKEKYSCPMHPKIIRGQPGKCPVCGMPLEKMRPKKIRSVMLDDRQKLLGNITTGVAGTGTLRPEIIAGGLLTANADETDVIAARVDGRIDKLFIKQPGQTLLQGQPLYRIYSESLLTFQEEFVIAVRRRDSGTDPAAHLFVASAEKKLRRIGMTDRQIGELASGKQPEGTILFFSPSTGIATEVNTTEGGYVSEGTPLFRLENLDRLWADVLVWAGDASQFRVGQTLALRSGDQAVVQIPGRIIFISPDSDPRSQSIRIRLMVDNKSHALRPGQRVTVLQPVEKEKDAITVPSSAIVHNGSETEIWVEASDGSFEPRMVQTGNETSDNVEVLNGLRNGEHVVVSGAWLLHAEEKRESE